MTERADRGIRRATHGLTAALQPGYALHVQGDLEERLDLGVQPVRFPTKTTITCRADHHEREEQR